VNSGDKTLHCRDCGQEFIWTAGEQRFFAEKGLVNQPTRCTACRTARRQATGGDTEGFVSRARVAHPVTCAACGRETTVPFVPRGDRPVYCSSCFDQQRTAAPSY
jgi:CxxC-x17-CxxC domain-containing protein